MTWSHVSYDIVQALGATKRMVRSSALVVVTLSLGLAGALTSFALVHILSGDPLPGRSKDLYLAWVNTTSPSVAPFQEEGIKPRAPSHISMRDAKALLSDGRALAQAVTADATVDMGLPFANEPRHLANLTVLLSSSMFPSMFRLKLQRGRFWSAAEESASAAVAVIDTTTAKALFGTANPLGRSVVISDHEFRVIGVSQPLHIEPHFYELDEWVFSHDAVESAYLPYTSAAEYGVTPDNKDQCEPSTVKQHTGPSLSVDVHRCQWLVYWLELNTKKQVSNYMHYLVNFVEAKYPSAPINGYPRADLYSVRQWLTESNVVPDGARLNMWMGGAFLLLCMINAGGFLTARFTGEISETGLRRALGATRASVFRRYIFQSVFLTAISGLVAIPIFLFGLFILRQQLPNSSNLLHADVDLMTVLMLATLIAGVTVGVVPAWNSSRADPSQLIKII